MSHKLPASAKPECYHLAGARAARIDRRAHNINTKEMLTRLLRRPLGLWRAQLRLALPQASLRLLDLVVAPRPVLAGAAPYDAGTPCDAGAPCDAGSAPYDDAAAAPADDDHHLWFAVPKSRISRSKKRTKAHGRLQNLKFKPRSDWRVDENTGRPVLRHRLLDSDLDATVERVREAKKRIEEGATKEDN